MLDISDLYSAVERVFGNPTEASTEDLSKACRFCATDNQSIEAVERVQDLKSSLLGLLNVSLEGRSDDDDGIVDVRRARLALRTLVNAANHSKKFAEGVTSDCLPLFRALLRVSELRTETFAALVALSRSMRIACGLDDSYPKLLGEVFLLWESQEVSDSDRSWLSALISIHLEEDFGFLSSCFADVSSDEFTALLHVTEVLMDSSHDGTASKVHPNNILFCVHLLERALYDFGEELSSERKSAYVEQIAYSIEILASAALKEDDYGAQVLDRPTAIENIVDILECVLDAQWIDENEERTHQKQPVHPDRPQKQVEVRCSRVQDSPRLAALSTAVHESPMELRATLKCAAVRAIGNLCCERQSLRLAAGARGAVLAVLRCARLTDNDKPFIVQWSVAALRFLCLGCPENQKILFEMDQKPSGVIDRQKLLKELGIDVEVDPTTGSIRLISQSKNIGDRKIVFMEFSEIERAVYGGNVEEDPELLAELLALQREEEEKQRRAASTAPAARAAPPPPKPKIDGLGLDPAVLAAALADDVDIDVSELENDPDLLAELSGLVGSSPTEAVAPVAPPPPAPSVAKADNSMLTRLNGLLAVYQKMLDASAKEGNSAKQRRHQRCVDKLKELISKAERGLVIDEAEIPPTPPSFVQPAPAQSPVSAPSLQPPPVPKRTSSASDVPSGSGIQPPPPPPIPRRESSSSVPPTHTASADEKKQKILTVLKRRRNEYVANGKAAVAAMDKPAAKHYVETAKLFDQALAALDTADPDELDMSEIPPSPPPYRKEASVSAVSAAVTQPKPTSFLGALQSRMQRFQELAQRAKQEGNDRRARMNMRMVEQYAAAIRDAKAGRPVAVAELPSTPDMPPLPPQRPAMAPSGPAPGIRPPPAVGPLAPTGQPGKSRNSTQLEFLIQRQSEFRHAAMQAKAKGNMELAKKYLLESKGFDKMIAAARAGLPVSIRSTPIPPQETTSQTTLQPRIVSAGSSSTTGIEGRGEALALMEKALIEQVQLAENSRMRFTRLGDVGKVKLFEDWARSAKQDLLLVREVAKQGLRLPQFHYEMRHIPSADLFPDLAEDVLELSIIRCRDVPLPSGYEPSDADLFVKFTFPYPSEAVQSGKTKHVYGTQNPEFDEMAMLQIGSKKARGHKLHRLLKRAPLKFEVYQKGGFLRSDKLLGTCDWKLEQLESSALLEESLPLKEGRRAVGGLLTVKIRVREPLGDPKLSTTQHRWLVLDN
ncbi:unnamed protein product [Cylicocyclus nassatus]|uniref:Ataxin-10 n=1 Tax=Cylicocyclus nassatus TaxID=53992 RepID=A0AA36M0I2_CYLNA|nr:unnamed protein product [Cylicocyclus nassatus]